MLTLAWLPASERDPRVSDHRFDLNPWWPDEPALTAILRWAVTHLSWIFVRLSSVSSLNTSIKYYLLAIIIPKCTSSSKTFYQGLIIRVNNWSDTEEIDRLDVLIKPHRGSFFKCEWSLLVVVSEWSNIYRGGNNKCWISEDRLGKVAARSAVFRPQIQRNWAMSLLSRYTAYSK